MFYDVVSLGTTKCRQRAEFKYLGPHLTYEQLLEIMHPVETNLFGEWRGPRAKKRETKSEKPTKNRSCSQSKLVKIMVCVVRSATRMSQAKYANEPVVSRITRFHLDVLAVPRANWIGD